MIKKKPILVTGSHRSGTTWTGKIISTAPKVCYIHEPFNIRIHTGINPDSFSYWFQYVSDENANYYLGKIENILNFQYPLFTNILRIRSIQDFTRFIKDSSRFSVYRMTKPKPLIKDPIAFFSAEWLHKNFSCDVVALIRHPAAFCASLKIKDWKHDFSHFKKQPLLMDKFLGPFEKEINDFIISERDIIDQGILLWNCIHHTMIHYKNNYSDWIFIRHEDLSLDPLNEFRRIFNKLDLEFTRKVQSKILQSSSASNPTEQIAGNEYIRNSKENIMNWKKRLTKDEIDRIKKGTSEISTLFYTDNDW